MDTVRGGEQRDSAWSDKWRSPGDEEPGEWPEVIIMESDLVFTVLIMFSFLIGSLDSTKDSATILFDMIL